MRKIVLKYLYLTSLAFILLLTSCASTYTTRMSRIQQCIVCPIKIPLDKEIIVKHGTVLGIPHVMNRINLHDLLLIC